MNLKTKKKGQVAIELLILITFLLFLFTIFFLSINENLSEKINARKNLAIKEIAIAIQDEINLASTSSDDYKRIFEIPTTVQGQDYQVNIQDNLVSVKTEDHKHAIALPVKNITGNITKGENTISKTNGVITLNV